MTSQEMCSVLDDWNEIGTLVMRNVANDVGQFMALVWTVEHFVQSIKHKPRKHG